jgi:hypothetical protein
VSIRGAEAIWFCALDGKGITKTEKDTLEIVFRKYQFDESAAAFLRHKLEWLRIAQRAHEEPAPNERVTLAPDATILAVTDIIALPSPAPSSRAPNPLSLPPATRGTAPAALTKGAVAQIQGLEGANHLNGSWVTCEQWEAQKGRWRVRLENGDEVAVKPEKLLKALLPPPKHPGVAQGSPRALAPPPKDSQVAQGSPKALAPRSQAEGTTATAAHSGTGNGNDQLAVFGQPQPQTWSQKMFGWLVPSWFQSKRSIPAMEKNQHEEPPPKRRRVDSQASVDSPVAETCIGSPGIKLQELRDIFDECDRKRAGVVTKIDLIKACASNAKIAKFFELPYHIRQEDGTRTKFEDKWREIDSSGDREISWAELLAYYRHKVVDI